jgi:hypothetical protein
MPFKGTMSETYTGTLIRDLTALSEAVMRKERQYTEAISKERCAFSRCDEYGQWTCYKQATVKCEGCGMFVCYRHFYIVDTSPEKAAAMCASCASSVN